jgi:hypothetical protein
VLGESLEEILEEESAQEALTTHAQKAPVMQA